MRETACPQGEICSWQQGTPQLKLHVIAGYIDSTMIHINTQNIKQIVPVHATRPIARHEITVYTNWFLQTLGHWPKSTNPHVTDPAKLYWCKWYTPPHQSSEFSPDTDSPFQTNLVLNCTSLLILSHNCLQKCKGGTVVLAIYLIYNLYSLYTYNTNFCVCMWGSPLPIITMTFNEGNGRVVQGTRWKLSYVKYVQWWDHTWAMLTERGRTAAETWNERATALRHLRAATTLTFVSQRSAFT